MGGGWCGGVVWVGWVGAHRRSTTATGVLEMSSNHAGRNHSSADRHTGTATHSHTHTSTHNYCADTFTVAFFLLVIKIFSSPLYDV